MSLLVGIKSSIVNYSKRLRRTTRWKNEPYERRHMLDSTTSNKKIEKKNDTKCCTHTWNRKRTDRLHFCKHMRCLNEPLYSECKFIDVLREVWVFVFFFFSIPFHSEHGTHVTDTFTQIALRYMYVSGKVHAASCNTYTCVRWILTVIAFYVSLGCVAVCLCKAAKGQ